VVLIFWIFFRISIFPSFFLRLGALVSPFRGFFCPSRPLLTDLPQGAHAREVVGGHRQHKHLIDFPHAKQFKRMRRANIL
jgi:hypothetical protein